VACAAAGSLFRKVSFNASHRQITLTMSSAAEVTGGSTCHVCGKICPVLTSLV
jgi:hypothetical protein